MKIIKKISVLEVKRCFVIADMTKKNLYESVVRRVLDMNELHLDKIINRGYKKRLVALNKSDWFVAYVGIHESGIWRRAGGLPLSWTNGTIQDAAHMIRIHTLLKFRNKKRRAIHAIPGILKDTSILAQNKKYLLPIAFKARTGTPVRKYLRKKVEFDVDDGCMRSIALALSGKKIIKMYVGFPKK